MISMSFLRGLAAASLLSCAAFAASLTPAAALPSSTLWFGIQDDLGYLPAGSTTVQHYQAIPSVTWANPIVTANTITAVGSHDTGTTGDIGVQYDRVSGVATSVTPPLYEFVYDGDSDATYTYLMRFRTDDDGEIWRYDNDTLANPTLLFDAGKSGGETLGLTVDPTRDEFWVSDWAGGVVIRQFNAAGVQIGSFTPSLSLIGGLAFDTVNDTLFAIGINGDLHEYARDGSFIESNQLSLGDPAAFDQSGFSTQFYGMTFGQQPGAEPDIPLPGLAGLLLLGAGWLRQRI